LDSVYKIITLVGTSIESWEKAAAAAVEQAAKTLQDLRIAEIQELDMQKGGDQWVLNGFVT
jgi:flavin-binding protein dodecin